MNSLRGCFIVVVIISCVGMSSALTSTEVDKFFTTGYNWGSTNYTGNIDLTSSMTIIDKQTTTPAGVQTGLYHYFQFNGVPNYSKLGAANYEDWGAFGGWSKTIQAQSLTKCIPAEPELQANNACTSKSGWVGIMITGTPLWTYESSSGANAVADLITDTCGGHPNQDNKYHVHGFADFANGNLAGCLGNPDSLFNACTCPAPFLGVAIDGFPIYGPQKCDACKTYVSGSSGPCATFYDAPYSGLFTSAELTNGGRSVDKNNPTHDGDSAKDHVFEYRLHTDPPYHISCLRGSTVGPQKCIGANSSNAKKREDENLVEKETAEEEAELEEVEEELLESRLRYLLLKSLLDKRGKQ
ncbi:uncharacterized protein [Amphiura filiformis]|uniref:uncharacterized protein n=1 Tax=Amphiura filiformis TaxID=82378 RepID=UPI003B215D18